MDSSFVLSPSTTSKTPISSSRAATRARMRARTATNVQLQVLQGTNEPEQPAHLNIVEPRTISPPTLFPKQPEQRHFRPSIIERSSGDQGGVTPASSATMSSMTPSRSIQTSPTVCGPGSTAAPILEQRVQSPDHPTDIRKDTNQGSFTQEQPQYAAIFPAMHKRPRVRLYNENDESISHNRLEQINATDSNSQEYSADYESDLPYIPGRKAENNRRCLSWLKNIETNGD